MTTTETTQLSTAPSYDGETSGQSRARQAVTTARTKATATARQNPKSTTAGFLALAGAAAAAIFLGRRRAAAKAVVPRNRLAALLHR